jgi:hypothetical protein
VANARTVAIGLSFVDREGNRAKATCYCAFAVPQEDAWSLAFLVGDKMQAISNGVLSEIELTWRYTIDEPGTPAPESDVARKILMLVTNEDGEINGIVIPSPGDVWETTGSYAGIRLDLASAGALAFADMLLAIDLRTDDNRAVGTVLAAGGLAL